MTCPVCGSEEAKSVSYDGPSHITCTRCGKYEIGDVAAIQITGWAAEKRSNLSSWIRDNPSNKICASNLQKLVGLKAPTVGEKAEKLFVYLSKRFPKPGEKIAVELFISVGQFMDVADDRPTTSIKTADLLGVSWSQDENELRFLIEKCLISERGFLEKTAEDYLSITSMGWAHLDKGGIGHLPKVAIPRSKDVYVDAARIDELRAIRSATFDVSKLVKLCEELNLSLKSDCFFSIIVLTRSIIDHVPPIFGCSAFSQVANNYPGSKSFRASMRHLEDSSRKIADQHLHCQIRKSETLPTFTQVNFANDLDVLLAEVVRVLK